MNNESSKSTKSNASNDDLIIILGYKLLKLKCDYEDLQRKLKGCEEEAKSKLLS